MPPTWIIIAAALAVAVTALLSWILWRLNGAGRDGSDVSGSSSAAFVPPAGDSHHHSHHSQDSGGHHGGDGGGGHAGH